MRGPETRLRKRIVKALTELWPRAYIRKIHGSAFQNIGVADLLCCIDGYFFALEVKRPNKEATQAQAEEGKKVLKAKGIFGVVRSPEEAIKLVCRGLSWQEHRNR